MQKVALLFLLLTLGFGCAKKEVKKELDFEDLMGKAFAGWQYVQTQEDYDNLSFFRKVYEANIPFIKEPLSQTKIPKTLHFIWIGPKPFPRSSIENVRSWIAKNPGWKVNFWTDRARPLPHPSMELVMIQDFTFLQLEDCFQKSDNYGEKSDVLRYEILYQEGGVYADHDVKCIKSFDALNNAYDFYCGMELPFQTGLSSSVLPTNNLLGSRASHPILKGCMDWLQQNWDRIEIDYPGKDKESVINRVTHRTFVVLGETFKKVANAQGTRDIAFPTFYFNAPKEDLAIFARHEYKGTWFENETQFEKHTRERLMYISKKTNKIILFCSFLGAINAIGLFGLFFLLKKKKAL